MNFFRGVFLIVISIFAFSCDAPHLNPADPQNPNNKIAQVDGYVLTYEQPRVAIPNVKVVWKNQNVLAYTDSTGYFKIQDIQRVNGKLLFEKDGYSKDSVLVDWKNQNSKRVETILLSYTFGDLDGFVFASDQPTVPISKVKVFWKNSNLIVETNSSGYFKIENVPIRSGMIYFEKDGYNSDSLFVEWSTQKTKRIDNISLHPNIGSLDGFVQTEDSPNQPIANVKVFWKNQNVYASTNSSGYFKIDNIPIKSGMIYFEKDGFKKDSVYVNWTTERSKRISTVFLSYNIGSITGTIYTVALPRKPISKTKIFWKNNNILTETDANGNFGIYNVTTQNGYIHFDKTGYSSDSVYVNWNGKNSVRVEGFLNANPQLDSLSIYTIVENRYPDIQRYRLQISAKISDAEINDIALVYVQNNNLKLNSQLIYNNATRNYERLFELTDLNISSMDEAIGENFNIIVRDQSGKLFNVGSSTIKRIIRQEVTIESPTDRQTTTSKPTLKWKRYLPGFNFKYLIQIYTDEVAPILVWQKENVSKDDIEITPNITLPAGDYFWVIWVIDDFGDRGRTKPATFIVK
ncbi:MAG: hypothetical protein HZA74_08700 [Ignavibacteriales bacterium]|nr:hypothetical protein [Ignavibacteriales bacterium]